MRENKSVPVLPSPIPITHSLTPLFIIIISQICKSKSFTISLKLATLSTIYIHI